MNWLDCLLVAILLFSVVAAARRGFSREVIGLAATAVALVLAMWFYGLAGSYLTPWIHSDRTANLIGFLLVVLAVLLCGSMIGWIVHRFLRTIGLSFFDRLLGAAFGLVRGILIAVALLTAFTAFGPRFDSQTVPDAMLHSRIAPWVLDASHVLVALAPMELKSSFAKQYGQVKSLLAKNGPARND
ncbi:MAG TPA: CvpA family protein [Bryobacteraceae bacterium]|nr:CvpA family protein [Bryobacteraceae bacterium]